MIKSTFVLLATYLNFVAAGASAPTICTLPLTTVVDSSGCSGVAVRDAQGVWNIVCSGSTCGTNGTSPCQPCIGGAPGAATSFCGCLGESPQTPICCFTSIDTDHNTVFGGGFCYGENSPLTDDCYALPPCDALRLPGMPVGTKVAVCLGGPPEEPHD